MDVETGDHLRVKTELVPVRIHTSHFVIEGNAHAKPGGYYSRVTDVLNLSKVSFIPITEARYWARSETGKKTVESKCLVVKVENIEMMDLLEGT